MAYRTLIAEEVADYLGEEFGRKLQEPVVETMVLERVITLARAGEILDLDAWEIAEWWTQRGHGYPPFSTEDLGADDAAADLIPPRRS